MYIEQIRFDEVFDVQALRGDFSFRSAGRVHYGVNLQNRVIPRAGSRFAVAFEKPGDWASVLGCRDLASSRVRLRQATWTALLAQGGDLLLFGPLYIGAGLALGGSWVGMVAAALFLLVLMLAIAHVVRLNRKVKRALLAVQGEAFPDNGRAAFPSATR